MFRKDCTYFPKELRDSSSVGSIPLIKLARMGSEVSEVWVQTLFTEFMILSMVFQFYELPFSSSKSIDDDIFFTNLMKKLNEVKSI